MSSRLLTMKFMQRAAASSPTASSPQTPELPSPKRRKTENGSTPTKFDVDALADKRAIQAAIASEEAKRQAALEKQANDAGDTRWVLSFEEQERAANGARKEKPLRVVQIGWGAIDSNRDQVKYEEESEEEEEERPAMVGRRSFGKFNKVVEVCLLGIMLTRESALTLRRKRNRTKIPRRRKRRKMRRTKRTRRKILKKTISIPKTPHHNSLK